MADNDVRIKLSLDGADSVSKGLAGVGDGAQTGDSKLKSLATGGLAAAGKALVGLSVAAAGAGLALGKAVVSNYAEYEQNVGGIETMFKDSSDKMMKYASEAYKTAGLSANDYMAQATSFSAALLQGLGGDTAKAADYANMAMTDMSDNANKFGSDIGSIQQAYQGFAKQNYTMLDNLKLGYGGTAAEMARLVNDSGVMGDSFTATASNINSISYDKIIDAIHTVQTNMDITGTTAKEASTTISGSVGMMKASFTNLLTGLGDANADVSTLAGNVLTSFSQVATNITPVIKNIGDNITTLGPQIGEALTSIVGMASTLLPTILQAGTQIVLSLIQGISSALPQLISTVVPIIMTFIQGLVGQLPMLIDAGMKALTALIQGISQSLPTLIPAMVAAVMQMVQALVDNLPMLLDAALQLVTGLAQGLIAAIPVLIEALPQLIDSLITFIIGAIPQLIDAGIQLLVSLIGALPQIISTIVANLPKIISGIIGGLIKAIPQLVQAGVQLLVAIVQNLPAIISGVIKAIPQIISALVSGLGQGVSQLATVGLNLIKGLWNGISNAAGWIKDKISGFMGNIIGGIKSFFGIGSPSKLFANEIGRWLPAGLAVGVEANTGDAVRSVKSLGDTIMDTMGKTDLTAQMTTAGLNIPATITAQAGTLMSSAVPQSSVTATPSQTTGSTVTFSGPLVNIENANVRNDQDIRDLSTQLKTDMTRELRARGQLV